MLKCWTGSSKPTTKTAKLLVDTGNLLRGIARKFAIH